MAPNIWPNEVEGFRETYARLYAEFDRVGAKLLSAIALFLELDKDWFVDPVRDGNSIIRLLHYPPVSPDAPGVRAGAHEDINLITMLLGAEEGGLQLLDRNGNWLPVPPPDGAMVINVGDMLQRLTNGVLPSTSHRVVNPPPERRGVSRYSMPFFLHLRPDFMIELCRNASRLRTPYASRPSQRMTICTNAWWKSASPKPEAGTLFPPAAHSDADGLTAFAQCKLHDFDLHMKDLVILQEHGFDNMLGYGFDELEVLAGRQRSSRGVL